MPAPAAYARRQFPGAAVDTTLFAGINNSDLLCTLVATTGWPAGAYTGGVLCELYSTSTGVTAEKVWATDLTGSTLTIVRAADGTSATTHAAGTGIRPVAGAIDADEANRAVSETIGQVTAAGQILVGDGAASLAAVAAGTSGRILVGNGTTVASVAVSGDVTLSSAGAVAIADDAVDSAEIADGAIDLVHMSANSVDSDQYVDGSIDLVHMSANSVDSDQYVDGSIDTAHIADDQVTLAKMAPTAKPRYLVGPFYWLVSSGDGYGNLAGGVVSYAAIEACAVVGVSVVGEAARVAGSCSIVPQIDLAATSLACTIDGTNIVSDTDSQAETVDAMAAGQGLQVHFDTTALDGPNALVAFVMLQAV